MIVDEIFEHLFTRDLCPTCVHYGGCSYQREHGSDCYKRDIVYKLLRER